MPRAPAWCCRRPQLTPRHHHRGQDWPKSRCTPGHSAYWPSTPPHSPQSAHRLTLGRGTRRGGAPGRTCRCRDSRWEWAAGAWPWWPPGAWARSGGLGCWRPGPPNCLAPAHLQRVHALEEGFIQKRRQRSSLMFGGQHLSIPCCASYFAVGRFEE